jgi:transposase InsO family protein
MDTCKIGPNLYQYTAIDDCTRCRVLQIIKKRTASNTLDFLEKVLEQIPFPIQRVQTDRGMEFFAEKVQWRLMEYGIKFRPNKPGSPHLNGKAGRSQKTDKEEFYSTVDLNAGNLEDLYWRNGSTITTSFGLIVPLEARALMNAALS